MKVGVNQFVHRQTKKSCFSYYDGSFEDVAILAQKHMVASCMRQGYRDGVLEVEVPPTGFFSAVVQLTEDQTLVGCYSARREGEEPRKHVEVVRGVKMPARGVTLILYRHDVLGADASTAAEWELISINARTTSMPEPINPEVLMANHFGASGSTPTLMTESQFLKALRESFEYWKDKAMVAG